MQESTSSARYAQSMLDAVSFSLLLLDDRGVILSTNKPWRDSYLARGDASSGPGAGGNYLNICDSAQGSHARSAQDMAAGIRSVLGGEKQNFALDYPCGQSWYMGGVTRLEDQGEVRAVVTRLDISERRMLELSVIAELTFQNEEKAKRAAELVIANVELAFQNEEKGKRAAELAIANLELAFQNEEKGKRAAELVIARDEAQSANLAKSSFLANMSHEIRTPLGAIYGMANLIAKEPLSPTQADRMDKLQAAFKHLSRTINGLLDFSKIEANKLELEEGPVQPDQMMTHIAAMVLGSIEEKGLQLHLHTDAMPQDLLGDSTRLAQAMLNYAANAVKFTDAGTISLSAHVVEDSADASLLRFQVQDTGMGIPASAIPKLFLPFVQTDHSTTRTHGGTGLGLAITKRLAEAMGGDAGVSSAPGQGSTFWFTARLRKGRSLEAEVPNEPLLSAAEILKREFAGRRVLLVEDDDFNRMVGSILLADVGLQVDEAVDGQMAVEMASSKVYDLILMDMQMPKLDGVEATRQIRAAAVGFAVPIVALTANAFLEDKMRCMDAGMNDFLTKPLEPVVLYQVLLHHLKTHSRP